MEEELDYKPRVVRALNFLEDYMPRFLAYQSSLQVGKIEARNEKRAVYMLTSFIEVRWRCVAVVCLMLLWASLILM